MGNEFNSCCAHRQENFDNSNPDEHEKDDLKNLFNQNLAPSSKSYQVDQCQSKDQRDFKKFMKHQKRNQRTFYSQNSDISDELQLSQASNSNLLFDDENQSKNINKKENKVYMQNLFSLDLHTYDAEDSESVNSTNLNQKQNETFNSHCQDKKQQNINEFGDDLESYAWDGPEDSDEEIEEFVNLKNKQEEELQIKFSKNGIINFIENLFQYESPNSIDQKNAQLWQKQLDIQGFKMFLKKGGSQFQKNQPYIRTEMTFQQIFKLDKLVDAIYNPENQIVHDKMLQNVQKIQIKKNLNSAFLCYMQFKPLYTFQSRDFYEKGFQFSHKGKFYRYSCSIENSEQETQINDLSKKALPDKKTVRGITYINVGIFYRDNDGKIIGKTMTQCDFKLNFPSFILTKFLPNQTKQWYKNISMYYISKFI